MVSEHPKTIYMNILVQKKTEKLDNMVKEKVGAKLPGFIGKAAGSLVTHIVKADTIASKIAAAMPEKIPAQMETMGITSDCKCVYQHKSFTVVRLDVRHVDVEKLLGAKAGAEKAKKASGIMACCLGIAKICCTDPEDALDGKLTGKLGEALKKKLPELLPEKLADKGIEVEMTANERAEEEAYLSQALTPEEYRKVSW